MNLKKLACFLLLALIFCAAATASVPSPGRAFYYLDQADVLSDETEGEIFYSNMLLQDACGAQIVVVTVNSTNGESMSDYTYELFNKWGIGDSKKNNGFLLVLAIEDEDYYAVTGSGLQPKFTSSALKQYYDDYLESDFAAGSYDSGVQKFFEAVFERVSDTYSAGVTIQDGIAAYEANEGEAQVFTPQKRGASYSRSDGDEEIGGGSMLLGVIAMLIVIFALVTMMRRSRRRSTFQTPPPPPMGMPGPGGYRGNYRGPAYRQPRRNNDWAIFGLLSGMNDILGGSGRSSSSRRSSSSSRSSFSSSFRSSSSSRSASGGGGRTSGGGAGRGRH